MRKKGEGDIPLQNTPFFAGADRNKRIKKKIFHISHLKKKVNDAMYYVSVIHIPQICVGWPQLEYLDR